LFSFIVFAIRAVDKVQKPCDSDSWRTFEKRALRGAMEPDGGGLTGERRTLNFKEPHNCYPTLLHVLLGTSNEE
jgi:hypothetical protein